MLEVCTEESLLNRLYQKKGSDDMRNVLVVVVTYYPEQNLLKSNINAYLPYVDKIIIWENTPSKDARNYRYFQNDKIEYQTTGENIGISVALNRVLRYAKENEYEYILTMDQDSRFEDFGTYIEKVFLKFSTEDCIVGPVTNADQLFDDFIPISGYIINSGLIAKVDTLLSIGGYCEDFKVDAIDLELCLRAHANNVPVYRYMGSHLIQQFGSPSEVTILGRKIVTCGYSPFRLKGIFRNHIITYRKYNHSQYVLSLIKVYYRHLIPGIICIDKHKFKKLWSIVKGTFEGITFKE